ncbi:MAG: hypothetical protein WC028_29940 [Candidatus Obscuribacterales bacterium]
MNDETEKLNGQSKVLSDVVADRIDLTECCDDAETLWALANDLSCDVRFALAENHNIDSDILAILAEDENPYVAWRARKTIKRLTIGSAISGNFSWPEAQSNRRLADGRS